MKHAIIAVFGLFTLWILVETNMGRLYRIAYGDIVPPDIVYTGGKIQAHDIVLDTIIYPWNDDYVKKHVCSVSCKWILKETPFKELHVSFNEEDDDENHHQSQIYLAKMVRPCEWWHDDECIEISSENEKPRNANTLIFRKYYIVRTFNFAYVQYIGHQVCLGGHVIAQYGQMKWLSKTWLAKLLQVGRGAPGKDFTGSMIDASKQMELLLQEVIKFNHPTEGENQCPRISIGA